MAKDFLLNNKNFNLYNPNPNIFDYFEKKKTVLNIVTDKPLGSAEKTWDTIKINQQFDGWITDMILRIKLPSLLETDPEDGGYLNWVDNIGHAIIKKVHLKAFNKDIYKDQNYGLVLDIYNEINDVNNEEWELIGKNASVESLKTYQTKDKIIYVPLHFWFSKNNESAFPHFLVNKSNGLNDNCLQFTLTTRSIIELIVSSGSKTYSSYKDKTVTIDLIYDSVRAKNSSPDTSLDNTIQSLYNSYKNKNNPYRIYFDVYNEETQETTDSGTSIIQCNNSAIKGPLKYIYFVIRNNDRLKIPSTAGSPTILINEAPDDTHPNDIFNYSNIALLTSLNTYDTFETLNVKITTNLEGWVTQNPNLDAIYYRRLVPYLNKTHVPQKHIYTIDFSNSIGNEINGYLNNNNSKTNLVSLIFNNKMNTSKISQIYVVINYLNVYIDDNNLLNISDGLDTGWTRKPEDRYPSIINDLKHSGSMNNNIGISSSNIWYNHGIGTTLLGLNPQWNQNFGEIGAGKVSTIDDLLTEPNIALKLAISLEGLANQKIPINELQSSSIFGGNGNTGTDIIDIKKEHIIKMNSVLRCNRNKDNNNISGKSINLKLQGKGLLIFMGNKIDKGKGFKLVIGNKVTIKNMECFLTENGNNIITMEKKQIYTNVDSIIFTSKDSITILSGSYIYFENKSNSLVVKMMMRSSGDKLSMTIK